MITLNYVLYSRLINKLSITYVQYRNLTFKINMIGMHFTIFFLVILIILCCSIYTIFDVVYIQIFYVRISVTVYYFMARYTKIISEFD